LSSAFAGWFPCHSALEVIVALRDCQTSLSRCLHTKNQSQQEESFNRGSMRKANPRFKLTSLCATRTIAGSENKRECGVSSSTPSRLVVCVCSTVRSKSSSHAHEASLPSVVAIPSRRMRRKRATIIVGSGQQIPVCNGLVVTLAACRSNQQAHPLNHSSLHTTVRSNFIEPVVGGFCKLDGRFGVERLAH
jgi:hypothetical protein